MSPSASSSSTRDEPASAGSPDASVVVSSTWSCSVAAVSSVTVSSVRVSSGIGASFGLRLGGGSLTRALLALLLGLLLGLLPRRGPDLLLLDHRRSGLDLEGLAVL